MYRSIVFACFIAAWIIVTPAAAQQPTPNIPVDTPDTFTTQTDPVSLIGAYYNAISRGEYARAYDYWEEAPNAQTELQFATGFEDTQSARAIVWLPTYSDAGAGNVYADIPTLVVGLHYDGTEHYYQGCLRTHKTNVPVGNAPEPDPNWYLQEGDLREYLQPDFAALAAVCEFTATLQNPINPGGQLDPIALIESYFIAAAGGNSQQAAAYWEAGTGDLFAAAYSGLVNTAKDVQLFANPQIFSEGAAGSVYATIPVMVLITDVNDNQYPIIGCYVARKSNVPVGNAAEPDPNWHLYNATFTPAANDTESIRLLTGGCTDQG